MQTSFCLLLLTFATVMSKDAPVAGLFPNGTDYHVSVFFDNTGQLHFVCSKIILSPEPREANREPVEGVWAAQPEKHPGGRRRQDGHLP